MKAAVMLLSGLLLSALASGPAAAEQVRVRVTARVSQVTDTGNGLAGKIVVGQRVNGLYVYNTNTPNISPSPDFVGDYRPYANEARIRFAVGGLVFESQQPTQGIGILVQAQNFGEGQFNFLSSDNKPLADGGTVQQIFLSLRGQGNVTQSTALPDAAPDLQSYWTKEVTISGNSAAGPFFITAQLEVAELVGAEVVVSPASGTFAANQHFDAALILPRNSNVATVHATANGTPLPLSYPGSCQLQPQVGPTGKPSIVCPNADAALTVVPGAPIVWTVELANGTVYTETVTWERAP